MTNKLLEVQQEIKAIKKDQDNPFFHSKYFDINALIAEVKPILNKHGLMVWQPIVIKDGKNILETHITDFIDPSLSTQQKNALYSSIILPEGLDAQKFGAAITYYRRYALQSLLCLEAEDDDGNTASGKVLGSKSSPSALHEATEPMPEDFAKKDEEIVYPTDEDRKRASEANKKFIALIVSAQLKKDGIEPADAAGYSAQQYTDWIGANLGLELEEQNYSLIARELTKKFNTRSTLTNRLKPKK